MSVTAFRPKSLSAVGVNPFSFCLNPGAGPFRSHRWAISFCARAAAVAASRIFTSEARTVFGGERLDHHLTVGGDVLARGLAVEGEDLAVGSVVVEANLIGRLEGEASGLGRRGGETGGGIDLDERGRERRARCIGLVD